MKDSSNKLYGSKSYNNRIVSIFIICLIIAMPILSADAIAASNIRNVTIYGNDKIDDYINSKKDRIIFSAEFFRNAEEIKPDEVLLTNIHAREEFNQGCVAIEDGYYRCSHEDDVTDLVGARGIYFRLYDNGNEINNEYKQYFADSISPQIRIIEEPKQNGKNVTIKFKVTDYACGTQTCTGCSGIKTITVNGVNIDDNFTECIYETEYDVVIKEEELQNIVITTEDMFGLKNTKSSSEFDADLTSPVFIANSLEFRQQGTKIDTISGRGMVMSMFITVKDERSTIDITEVKAKLNELLEGYSDNFVPANRCNKDDDDNIVCEWENVHVKFDDKTTASVDIEFSVADIKGNIASATQSYGFKIDKIRPEGVLVGTEFCSDKECYVKPGINKFVAKIKENGAGFNAYYSTNEKTDVYTSSYDLAEALKAGEIGKGAVIDISRLNSEVGPARTTNCSEVSGLWECFGYADVPEELPHMGFYRIYLTDHTTDDVGNQIEGEQEGNIVVDKKKPVIINQTIYGIADSSTRSTYYQQGDLISIEAYITDNTQISAFANITELIGGSDTIEGSCQEVGFVNGSIEKIYKCNWNEVGILLSQAPSNNKKDYQLIFKDIVENNVSATGNITVLLRSDLEPSFWHVENINTFPSQLDRQTMPLIAMTAYAEINLKSHEPNAEIIETIAYECSGDDEDYLIDVPVSVHTGGNKQILKFNFARRDISETKTSLDYKCKIGIITQVNYNVYKEEIEEFDLRFSLYNMPLGKIDDNLKGLIEDAKGDTLFKIADKLKILEKLLDITEKFCQLEGMLNAAFTVYSLFSGDLDILTLAGMEPAKQSAKNQNNKFFKFYHEKAMPFLHKFCEWGSCRSATTHLNKAYDRMGGITFPGDKYTDGSNPQSQIDAKNTQAFGASVTDSLRQKGFDDVSMWPQNPEDSLVLSMIAMCPAGIIKNLKKYRQITCSYIDCLQNQVPDGKATIHACTLQHDYMQCKYVYGEIFQVMPFMHIWKRFGRQVKSLLADPVSLVYGAAGYFCNPDSYYLNSASALCTLSHYTKSLGKIIQDIEGIKNLEQGMSFDAPASYDACSAVGLD